MAKIKGVTKDSELSDTGKVQRIGALLADNHIATSLDADQIEELKAAMITELSGMTTTSSWPRSPYDCKIA